MGCGAAGWWAVMHQEFWHRSWPGRGSKSGIRHPTDSNCVPVNTKPSADIGNTRELSSRNTTLESARVVQDTLHHHTRLILHWLSRLFFSSTHKWTTVFTSIKYILLVFAIAFEPEYFETATPRSLTDEISNKDNSAGGRISLVKDTRTLC